MTLRRDMVAQRGIFALLVGIYLLVLAACGATPDHVTPPASTAAPTPTTAAPPPASDGTDLAACLDGACEVRVDGPVSIPLDPRFRLGSLEVTSIKATMVTMLVKSPGGYSANVTGCIGSSLSTDKDRTQIDISVSVGCRIELPTITVDVVAIAPGGAVLRFAIPAATDGTDLNACADGTCAVLVDKPVSIPLNPQFQLGSLRVESIATGTITIAVDYAGTINYQCPDDKCHFETPPGGFRMTLTPGSQVVVSGVAVQVAVVGEGTAVLRLKPKQ